MRDLTKTGKKINASIAKAIHDYNLIEEGDKILVAVSGGKDSLTLLTLLSQIRGWAPVKFDLMAAHIRTDFHCSGCAHRETLTEIFEKMSIPHVFKDIKVLDKERKTTCFWCSWNRRKTLFEIAAEHTCNKIALGHHKDDIAETVLMNILYKGEVSAINPRQELFGGKLTIIRPLCYVDEDIIKVFAKESGFPSQLCACPFGAESKRKYVKRLICDAQNDSPAINIKTNIFKSISRVKKDYINLNQEVS